MSIVMPVYNEEKLIDESMETIVSTMRQIDLRYDVDAMKMYNEDGTPLTHTTANFAPFLPSRRIGGLVDEDSFGSMPLAFRVAMPESRERYAFGQLFLADTNPTLGFLAYVLVSYPLSHRIARRLQPDLLLGHCCLDGSYSRNTMRLQRTGDVNVYGGYTSAAAQTIKTTVNRLACTLLCYGVYLVPGSMHVARAGEGLHHASTVPMQVAPLTSEGNAGGEEQGLQGIHVVDGAALTTLPAKTHTLTIMANANRISTALATAMPTSPHL